MNDEGVSRTAPATQDMLKIVQLSLLFLSSTNNVGAYVILKNFPLLQGLLRIGPHIFLQVAAPVWVRMCLFKWCLLENPEPHSVPIKGFSLVWVLMCDFKLLLCENAASHSVQMKGFSPVCMGAHVYLQVAVL